MQRRCGILIFRLIESCVIWKLNLEAYRERGYNVDTFKSGGLLQAEATRNVGTISTFLSNYSKVASH
jgi:hypothetical protein